MSLVAKAKLSGTLKCSPSPGQSHH
uniref:Uncharacterized protein n=1 Tax=Anguilla anguilla TaxID=7936 RepID=A0A0E9VZP2_ANGAN